MTYFPLREGVVWPECLKAHPPKLPECLRAGTNIAGLYNEDREVKRFANITVYPCNTNTNDLFNDFNRDIEDYPSDFKFTDYLVQECGYEPYLLVRDEVLQEDLPPRPRTYADVLRDEIAVDLGYDDWTHYYDEVGSVIVRVDGCTIEVAHLEAIGDVWLERYPNEVSWQPDPEYRSPVEASENVVAALGVIIGSEYPIVFDGVAYHDDNWIRWAQSCGWIEE